MDLNQIQGQILLRDGLVTQQLIQQAYAALPNHPDNDLCQLLVEHGVLNAQAAEQIRQRSLAPSSSSGILAPLATSNTYTSSGQLPSYVGAQTRNDVSQVQHSAEMSYDSESDIASVIGDYKIIRELGRGGMGAVYLAYSNKLQKEVALKTLLNNSDDIDFEGLERFQIECQTMARFDHPNIVKVYDYGQHNGNPYLVMESIQGQSLKDLIHDRGQLDNKEAAKITLKLANALQYAHQRFVLHRDIKPENVLIRALDQEPILMDFGLAKELEDSKEGLTVTGQFLGTPAYMPPEQATGSNERIEKRSDIYSLGVTLYEMISGRRPFQEPSLPNLILAIMKEPPPRPSSFIPTIDRELDVITLKCLEKDPFDRYIGARALADDLQRYLDGDTILAAPPSKAERFKRWRTRYSTQIKVGMISVFLTALILAVPATESLRAELNSTRRYDQLQADFQARSMRKNKNWEFQLEELRKVIKALKAGDKDSQASEVQKWQQELEELRTSSHKALTQTAELVKQINEEGESLSELQKDLLLKTALQTLNVKKIEVQASTLSALLAQKTGDSERAERERFRILRIDPEGTLAAQSLLELGRSMFDQRHHRQTIAILSRLITPNQDPKILNEARVTLAEAYFREGRISEANAVLKNGAESLTASLSKQGRWLQKLSASLAGHIKFPRPKNRRLIYDKSRVPHYIEVLRNDSKTTLSLLEVTVSKTRLNYNPISELALSGQATHISTQEYKGSSLLIITLLENNNYHLEVFKLDDKQLARVLKSRSAPFLRDFSPIGVGDCNGNGALDFILARQTSKRLWYDAGELNSAFIEAKDLSGSWGMTNRFTDLNSDGRDEIVFGGGVWQSWECTVIPGHAGQQAAKAQSQLVGVILGMDHSGTADKPELLFSASRKRSEDVAVKFKIDLSPKLPDAIWRARFSDSKLTLEKLVELPFEERDRFEIGQVRSIQALTKTTGDFLYILSDHKAGQRSIIFQSDKLSLEIPNHAHSTQLLDLDKDGDLELFMDRRNETLVYGLESLSEKQSKKPREVVPFLEEQLELAALLIQEKDGFRASILLDILRKDEDIPSALIPTIELMYVEALIQLKQYREARILCKRIAASSFSARRIALEKAAHLAAQAELYGEAINDLKELTKLTNITEFQRTKYLRRIDQFHSLSNSTPIISINSTTLPKQVTVEKPLFVDVSSNIRLTGSTRNHAAINIPVSYNGQSFRLKGTLKIHELGFSSAVYINLRKDSKENTGNVFRVRYRCDGSGDEMTWNRDCRVEQPGHLVSHHLDQFSDAQTLKFDIVYQAEDRAVSAKFYFDNELHQFSGIRGKDLDPGAYILDIAAGQAKSEKDPARPISQFDISILELEFLADKNVMSLRPEPLSPLGHAHFALVQENYDEAERRYIDLLRSSKDEAANAEACFHLAITQLRSGSVNRARESFQLLKRTDPNRFNQLWREYFSGLRDKTRKMIAEVLYPMADKNAYASAIRGVMGKRSPDLSLAALYCAASEHPTDLKGLSGALLFLQGDHAGAERIFRALPQKPYSESTHFLGLIAYSRGNFTQALECWRDIKKWPPNFRSQKYSKYVRASFLLQKQKKGS